MDTVELELLHRLGECHRPRVRPYPDGPPGWMVTQCRACDGAVWFIVSDDPEEGPRECEYWREYRNRMPT